jgi:hypothetical protein
VKHAAFARAWFCALAITLSGCYWLVQYEDLSGGGGDAGVALDARSDDGGPAQSFCPADAGPLVYCMDFDEVDAGALGLQIQAAEVAIVNGEHVSPPNSLFVGLQGDGSFGRFAKSFPFQPTTARLEFQVRIGALQEWVTTLAIALSQDSTQTVRTLNVVMAPNGGFQVQEYFTLADGGTALHPHTMFQVGAGAATGGFYHVVLTLSVDEANAQYRSGLAVDDQVLEHDQPLTLPWAGGAASIHVGVTYAAAAGPQLYFDNIRADFAMQ